MKRRILSSVAAAWFCLSVMGVIGLGATVLVAPGADIQAAIDNATPGDTIELAAGVHDVPATIVINKALTLSGVGEATVQGTTANALSVFKITSSDVTIENLDITWSHVLESGYASPETADSLISVMGTGLSGIIVRDNILHVPYQGDNMKLWGARALTVDSNACGGIEIVGNTVYNTRNGIVIRYGNTAAINDNVIFDTKGGIMNYTSSLADAANRTMTGNSWGVTHNEWDIVWNSASYDPNYLDSVIGVSLANENGYVVDRRDAAGGHAVGNRSHIFLDPAGSTSVHEAKGNMHEPYATFALGVEAITSTGTIYVDIGTYQEQVVIDKSAVVVGAPGATVLAPDSPGQFKLNGSSTIWEPVVFAYSGTDDGSGNIVGVGVSSLDLSGLTIDGNDRVPTRRSAGVLLLNVAGTIHDNTIQNMSIDGKETFGIMVYGDSDVVLDGNTISGFSRGGIGVNSGTAVISNNTVLGPGLGIPVTWAPNGIQIGYGASGAIVGNEVSGCGWPGSDWAGTGIMVVDTSHVLVEGNTVHHNETGIGITDFPEAAYGSAWAGSVSDIVVQANTLEENEWALDIVNEAVGVLVKLNSFINNVYDAIDIYSYDYYFPGLGIPYPSDVEIHLNSIVGSGGDGLWVMDGIGAPVDATLNWWGDVDGPSGEGSGAGDSVSANVIFSPWLGSDPDGDPAPGVQITGPVLVVVDDLGPEPALGYLNTAIDGTNSADLPFADTIEVRSGTYDASMPIVETVNLFNGGTSTAGTALTGPITIEAPDVLLGRLGNGFTILGSVTTGAGVDASTVHINWNDILGLVTNAGLGTLDATFNYWGEDGPDTVGRVNIAPLLPESADVILGYMAEYDLNALDAIDFSYLLDELRKDKRALVGLDLMTTFGFSLDEALELIDLYGWSHVRNALRKSGGDYDEFLVQLLGYAIGGPAGGGGSLLGGGAGGTAGISRYCVGCTVPLFLELIHPLTGEIVDDACVSFTVCRTLDDGTVEIVLFGVVPFDGDLGAYSLDLETDGLTPGIYDIYIGTDDGRSRSFQIEIF